MKKLSFAEIRRMVPQSLLERFESEYSLHVVESILRGFAVEKLTIIRVNSLKTNILEIMRLFRNMNVRFERIAFLPDSLIISNRNERFFEELDLYDSGKIYFQGLSSQLPVLFLDPKPGEKILDMCAAPGSKTTQIAAAMMNSGEVVAMERDQIRFERLQYNLARQGASVVKACLGDAAKLVEGYSGYFDRVLLDTPCSAEGRIVFGDPRSSKFWSEKNIREHAKMQRRLLHGAVKALKVGGVLVYSTCTLAPEENELMVEWAIKQFGLKLDEIVLDFKYKLPILAGLAGTRNAAIKIMPSNISEGLFVVKMKKI